MGYFFKEIDKVRAGEAKELKGKGEAPVLNKSRWLLLKLNLRCAHAYLLGEEFQRFWRYILALGWALSRPVV